MLVFIRPRFAIWKHAFRWWWSVALGVWQPISALLTFRDNFMSPLWKQWLTSVASAIHWDWHWWVIGNLVILVIAALEGSYRGHRKVHGECVQGYEQQLTSKSDDIQQCQRALTIEADAHAETKELLRLERENLSYSPQIRLDYSTGGYPRAVYVNTGHEGYAVRLMAESGRYVLCSRTILALPRDGERLELVLKDRNGTFAEYHLVQENPETFLFHDLWGLEGGDFNYVATFTLGYRDSQGREYRSYSRVMWDFPNRKVERVEFIKIVRLPASADGNPDAPESPELTTHAD